MKFSNYLNEAYTADMQRLFKPYLKNIGDFLAETGISVNNLDFKDLGLVKPIALSSTLRTVKDFTETSWYDYDYLVCIFKHVSGGVSVCTGFMERDKIKDLKVISEFGDITGKVSNAFTAKVSVKEINNLAKIQRERSDLNQPAVDKHIIKGFLDKRLALQNNKNVMAIKKKAQAIGFKDPVCVVKYNSKHDYYSFYCKMSINNDRWIPGVPHTTIYIDNMYEFDWDNKSDTSTHIKVAAHYNNSSFSLDKNESNKWNNAKEKLLEFIDTYEKVRELADYINTFTYGDLLVEEE